MEILELMRTRRSVRKYVYREISDADIKTILSAALLAPSGHSKYPCEFIVVKNRETLMKLAKCRGANVAKMLENAACAIVVIADKEKSDTVIEDSSVSMMNMELAAASLGIGNCWIQVRARDAEDSTPAEDYLREILNFPETFMCQSVLALGYAEKMPRQRELDKLKFEKVHYENF